MRILCSTTPMEGVFAPALPLLTALQRDGHEVLVATAPDLADRVRAANLPTATAGPEAPAAAAQAVTDPAFAAGAQPWRIGAVLFARVMAPAKLPVLQQIATDFEPDVILHPPVDFAAPLVAAQRGIASITYDTGLPLESELMTAMADWVAPLPGSVATRRGAESLGAEIEQMPTAARVAKELVVEYGDRVTNRAGRSAATARAAPVPWAAAGSRAARTGQGPHRSTMRRSRRSRR